MLQTICVVGTDNRFDYLSEYLIQQGFSVVRYDTFSPEIVEGVDLLIGPVTFYKNSKLLPEIEAACRKEKVPVLNYMVSHEFLLQNARLTAEGFLSILIQNTPFSIFNAPILLLGMGRCGNAIYKLLKSIGVSVDAYDTVPNVLENPTSYSVVINTIPAQVITKDFLKSLDKNCILFDIATSPGGYEKDSVNDLGLRLICCPGIPGKTAPQSAGYAIGETAISYLN